MKKRNQVIKELAAKYNISNKQVHTIIKAYYNLVKQAAKEYKYLAISIEGLAVLKPTLVGIKRNRNKLKNTGIQDIKNKMNIKYKEQYAKKVKKYQDSIKPNI